MKATNTFFMASAMAALMASSALAQSTLTGTKALNDRLDDINTAAADDLARSSDAERFGNQELREGLSGGLALTYTGQSGNQDTQDFAVGGRLRYAQGQLVQTVGMSVSFSEDNGVKSEDEQFAVYDANYYFNKSNFYGFVLGRVQADKLAVGTDLEKDAFLGIGPGYRIVNTPDLAWRVQTGVGVNYTKTGAGVETTETGYIASSRFFYRINDNMFVSNDTDFLKSDTAFRINNDIGLNIKMTDAFSTRVSYLTDYQDNRTIRTDNKVGVSLVYGF